MSNVMWGSFCSTSLSVSVHSETICWLPPWLYIVRRTGVLAALGVVLDAAPHAASARAAAPPAVTVARRSRLARLISRLMLFPPGLARWAWAPRGIRAAQRGPVRRA